MESKVSSVSIPRDLVKCCECGHPSSTWFRSVKRKYDEFETTNRFSVPELDLDSNAKVQIENECAALRETVSSQQATIQELNRDLEEERNASSSAATEAMSMILKLQSEKAELQMEARQFKSYADEKMAHDQEAIMVLEDLLFKREQTIQALTCEAQAYKHRMLSYGLTEEEVEGEPDGEFHNMAENFGDSDDFLPYDYPPPKCSLNENPGDYVEDIEKYSFVETPREYLRNLEQRICIMERNLSSSHLSHGDGCYPATKNVSEKDGDSSNSFLPKETGSEFIGDSPRFDNSFKRMEFISETDKISGSRRMDNASEIEDDMSDRVYTIDSIHTGVPYEGTSKPIPGVGDRDDYGYSQRDAFDLPDVCDPDIKKLYARLQALEADRESMRQAIISMRTENAQLVLLKEIAQHLCKEMSPERQVTVRKPSILESLPFTSFFKWIISLFYWKRNRRSK
ncbi:myosin-binding protein 7-like [Hibiscus syriacus]|nr:myosin-binding protein 7-like [Hibiscus syriacus]